MKHVMDIVLNAIRGVACDRRGSIATFLAAAAIPLVAFGGLAVDTARGYLMKSRLSYALDSAALAAGRAMYDEDLRDQMVAVFFNANFPENYMGASVVGPVIEVDTVTNTIKLNASANMPTSLMQVLGFSTMDVTGNTEVTLSSRNVEVSLVVDITGSMAGSRIADLKTAAHGLVDIIVKDQQIPHYSKVAIVPYAAGVNLGSYASQVRGPISGGTCTSPGCTNYTFPRWQNSANQAQTFSISTCVSERTGINAYTDVAPSTSYVGRNYPAPNNPCPSSQIVPLTSNKTTLHDAIDLLDTEGSTAGQIGLAWGWYMVSPNFGYLWPADSQPADYGAEDLVKVVIFMTDGDLNTAHYNGVVAKDSGSGSGWSGYKINQNATNGSSFSQAQTLVHGDEGGGHNRLHRRFRRRVAACGPKPRSGLRDRPDIRLHAGQRHRTGAGVSRHRGERLAAPPVEIANAR